MELLVRLLLLGLAVSSTLGAGLELRASEGRVPGRGVVAVNAVVLPLVGIALFVARVPMPALDAAALLCICAGGSSGALVAGLSGEDRGVTAAIYARMLMASPLVVAVGMSVLAGAEGWQPALRVAIPSALLSGVPIFIGWKWHTVRPSSAEAWAPRVRRAGTLLLLAVVVLLLVTRVHLIAQVSAGALAVLLGLAVVFPLLGGISGGREAWRAGAILTLVRSLSNALPITELWKPGDIVGVHAAFFGLLMYAVGAGVALLGRRVASGR